MTISFELGTEFLAREDIPLSVDDLKYGFERGWIRGSTVIEWAVREIERGDDDTVLLEVASLLRSDVSNSRKCWRTSRQVTFTTRGSRLASGCISN